MILNPGSCIQDPGSAKLTQVLPSCHAVATKFDEVATKFDQVAILVRCVVMEALLVALILTVLVVFVVLGRVWVGLRRKVAGSSTEVRQKFDESAMTV